jgi:hypothetical protein
MSDGCFPFDERDPSVHLVPKDSMEDYRNRRDAELITA